MFSQRNMGAPSNAFTWLTLYNPFWRVRFCLSFLGNVACCRIFWFFYKVFLVWFGFVIVQQFFMLNTLRPFRPKVPSPLLHASRFRMWELQGRPPLIYCHSRQRRLETRWGRGRETLSPGGRQEIPLMGFEVVQVREAAVGSGKRQRRADCWSIPQSAAPTSLSLTLGSK